MRNLLLSALLLLVFANFSALQAQSVGLETGNKAPEIRLPTPKGDTISLSSLSGKVVLIDFWGTWCSPCVAEQADLARLYSQFKKSKFVNGNGFEIFGVSLDIKKAAWENFITAKKIDWIQVSDLKFWKSPVAKSYGIQELPFNLLIDGKGIILAKNLHGIDLEKGIAKYLIK